MNAEQTAVVSSQERGLIYITRAQRPDGGFESFSSPSASQFEKALVYHTTFVPALILGALGIVPSAASRHLRRRLVNFVTKQRSSGGSFNYWAKNSPERHRQPYPDDLDDTACALIGLALHDESLISPSVLADTVKLLLAAETQPGGPYRTWLAPPQKTGWQDIDLAVNANLAYLLSLVSRPLPGLTACMEQAIRSGQLASPYYPSSYPLIYYLSRAYAGPLTGELRAAAQHLQRAPAAQTALDQALLLSSLIRLGETDRPRLRSIVQDLLASQQSDGSWPAAAFCLDPTRGGIRHYNGCESLSTAFALEALQLYLTNQSADSPKQPAAATINRRDRAFDNKVLRSIRADCEHLSPELRQTMTTFLRRIVTSESGPEIVSLAVRFNQSLVPPLSGRPQAVLTSLGAANLYGWAAYTLFDDFLDEESGPGQLPAATTALRYSLAAFEQAVPRDSVFQRITQQTFDIIDGANAWELRRCRFVRRGQYLSVRTLPDYGDVANLANRSLGHTLTPLAVLRGNGISPRSRLFRNVRRAMIHYLAARQLNDDTHDWQADLEKGHITYVVAHVLQSAAIKPGRQRISPLIKRCQQPFWYQTLPEICRLIQQQTVLSRRHLSDLSELQARNTFTELLDAIDTSVANTLATQSDAEAFLKHFTTNHRPAA